MHISAYLLSTLLLCAVSPIKSLISASEQVLLSSDGKLLVYDIDPESGKLTAAYDVVIPSAGPIGVSRNKQFIYVSASLPQSDKKNVRSIATLTRGVDGKLQMVANHAVKNGPGYIMTDKQDNYMAGNHYGPGAITIWKLEGGIYKGETVQEIKVDEKAHSTLYSPDGQWLLVPTTGPNKVYQYRVDAVTGTATPNNPPYADGPQDDNAARQPRHLIYHPTLPIVYTTNEREHAGVGVWNWDSTTGLLTQKQNLVSVRSDFTGKITTADLHLTPNGKFLYISNRDITNQKAPTGTDDIVAYRVDPTAGTLTPIGHFPCERIPRWFTISASGKWLYVAGQGDSKLGIYRIDEQTGALARVDQLTIAGRPGWITAVNW